MSDKNMTLMMQIKAKADGLVAEVARVDASLKKMQDRVETLNSTGSATFGALGKGLGIFLSPMKLALQGGIALAGSMMALGGAAIYAAAGDEKLVSRLTAVYGSAARAKTVFNALEMQSMKSGKSTEDLADALIMLEQYGLSSSYNLGAVTNAAKVADTSIADMAMTIGALQSRGLKRLGISLDTKDDGYLISARDKSGKVRQVVAKDADEARKKLIGIFAFKFGTNMQATTFTGMFAALKNGLDQALSQFGDGLLPPAKSLIAYLNMEMEKLVKGQKLDEWGKKAGEWLQKAADNIIAGIKTLPEIWTGLQNVWKNGGDAMQKVLLAVFEAGAGIFSDVFVGMLSASGTIWAGIGKILAGAVMEPLLQLPGMTMAREHMMNNALEGMTSRERVDVKTKYNVGLPGGPKTIMDLNDKQQAEIAGMGGRAMLTSGVKDIMGSMKPLIETAAGSAKTRLLKVNQIFKEASGGVDVAGSYDKNLEDTKRQRAYGQFLAGNVLATGTRTRLVPRNGNKLIRDEVTDTVSSIVPAGRYNNGDVSSGGFHMHIEKLEVVANNIQQVQDAVLRAAGMTAMAAAGG